MATQITPQTAFDDFRDLYNSARNSRPVLTRDELWAAFLENESHTDLAAANDRLAAEYDAS